MTWLSVIAGWTGIPTERIQEMLVAGIHSHPEFAEPGALLMSKLNAEFTPESVAEMIAALPAEGLEILKGHFDSRSHRSDRG
jgi:hypothetical protein